MLLFYLYSRFVMVILTRSDHDVGQYGNEG